MQINEDIQSVKNRKETLLCNTCGTITDRIISIPADFCSPDKRIFYPYLGPTPMNLNYAEKQRYLKKHKLMESGDSVGGSKDEVIKSLRNKAEKQRQKKQDVERNKFFEKERARWQTTLGKKI